MDFRGIGVAAEMFGLLFFVLMVHTVCLFDFEWHTQRSLLYLSHLKE